MNALEYAVIREANQLALQIRVHGAAAILGRVKLAEQRRDLLRLLVDAHWIAEKKCGEDSGADMVPVLEAIAALVAHGVTTDAPARRLFTGVKRASVHIERPAVSPARAGL
jgi:hypothetical protein